MSSENTIYNNSNSSLENGTDFNYEPADIIQNKAVQALFCILYTTIFVLGIFGNVLVCYVVGRNKAMQTVTNFFITNLALSDILLCTLAVPFTPLYSFLGQWIFGPLLCHLVAYAQGTSVYISTLTLTSIAIDRFFVIIYPFHPRMKLSTCLAIIVSIWAFALLATLPYGVFMSHKSNGTFHYCEEAWATENYRKLFGALTATAQFGIPFFVMAFCYIKVSLKLGDRARAKPGAKNSRREEADRERKRRTNRMLIAMVTIFGVSWLPLNTVNLLNDVFIDIGSWAYYNLCFFMVHAIAMSSTCYNPFLYAWLNENFRKEFKQVLPCFDAPQSGLALGPATASMALSGHRRSVGGGSSRRGGGNRACNGNSEAQDLLPAASYSKNSEDVQLHLRGDQTAAANNIHEDIPEKINLTADEPAIANKLQVPDIEKGDNLQLAVDFTAEVKVNDTGNENVLQELRAPPQAPQIPRVTSGELL